MTVIDSHAEAVAPEQGAFFEPEDLPPQPTTRPAGNWSWPEPGVIHPEQGALLYSDESTVPEGSRGNFEALSLLWPALIDTAQDTGDEGELTVQLYRGRFGELAPTNVNDKTKTEIIARLGSDGLQILTLHLTKPDQDLFVWNLTRTERTSGARRTTELRVSPDRTDIFESTTSRFDQGRTQRRWLHKVEERQLALQEVHELLSEPVFDEVLQQTRVRQQNLKASKEAGKAFKNKGKNAKPDPKAESAKLSAKAQQRPAAASREPQLPQLPAPEVEPTPFAVRPLTAEVLESAHVLCTTDLTELLTAREEAQRQRSNHALLGHLTVLAATLHADLQTRTTRPFDWEAHCLKSLRQRLDALRDQPSVIEDRIAHAVMPTANYLARAVSPQTFVLGETTYKVALCQSGIQQKQELFRIDAPGRLTSFGLAGVSFHYRDGERVEVSDVNHIAYLANWEDFLQLHHDLQQSLKPVNW